MIVARADRACADASRERDRSLSLYLSVTLRRWLARGTLLGVWQESILKGQRLQSQGDEMVMASVVKAREEGFSWRAISRAAGRAPMYGRRWFQQAVKRGYIAWPSEPSEPSDGA